MRGFTVYLATMPDTQAHASPAPTLDLLIIGAGFAGLYLLHRARRRDR